MAATTETIKTLSLGAGINCNELIAESLIPSDFPKEFTLENCVDFAIHVGGVGLKPCFDAGNTKSVTVNSFDEMQRLASDCHAVGEINAKPELVKVSFSVDEPVAGKQKTAASKPASE